MRKQRKWNPKKRFQEFGASPCNFLICGLQPSQSIPARAGITRSQGDPHHGSPWHISWQFLDICCDILSDIDILFVFLWNIFWCSIWYSIWHSHLTRICFTFDLAFYLAFCDILLDILSCILSGISIWSIWHSREYSWIFYLTFCLWFISHIFWLSINGIQSGGVWVRGGPELASWQTSWRWHAGEEAGKWVRVLEWARGWVWSSVVCVNVCSCLLIPNNRTMGCKQSSAVKVSVVELSLMDRQLRDTNSKIWSNNWGIWKFPKMGDPKKYGWFIMEQPITIDDLRVPHFRRPPYKSLTKRRRIPLPHELGSCGCNQHNRLKPYRNWGSSRSSNRITRGEQKKQGSR